MDSKKTKTYKRLIKNNMQNRFTLFLSIFMFWNVHIVHTQPLFFHSERNEILLDITLSSI